MSRDETIVQYVKVLLAIIIAGCLIGSFSVLVEIRNSLVNNKAETCEETYRHYYLDEEKRMCTWVDLCKKD